MVGRRDPGHRGQGGVRHGSILRDIHKNLCMGHRDHPLLAACHLACRTLAGSLPVIFHGLPHFLG
jgi:hypothetical protein